MKIFIQTILIASLSIIGTSGDGLCGRPTDVAFIIDASRSIWPPHFKQQLTFVNQVVKTFDISPGKTQVSAITFSHDVRLEFNLTQYNNVKDVLKAIKAIDFTAGDTTETAEALNYTRRVVFDPQNGARPDVAHIAILLTDGKPSNQIQTEAMAKAAKDHGIMLFAIGIGDENTVDREGLARIVSDPPSEFLYVVDKFEELKTAKVKTWLGNQACQVETTPKTTPSPPTTTTPTTTTPTTTTTEEKPQGDIDTALEACQGKPADIVFVLDTSSSITFDPFQQQLSFVSDVIDIFDVTKDKTRVGVITFSDDAFEEFDLQKYPSKVAVKKAVSKIPYAGGSTYTGKAIEMMMNSFTPEKGSRPGVAHIAIILTDGASRNPARTLEMAAQAHAMGIYTFAIGVGKAEDLDEDELAAIASEPSTEYYFRVNNYGALDTIKSILAFKACAVKPTERPQGDQLNCVPSGPTDIIFAADLSTAGSRAVEDVTMLIQNTGGAFETESGAIRLGVAMNGCINEATNIQLGTFTSREEFVNSFTGVEHSDLPSLMRRIRRDFSSSRGRDKIVVLVVEGEIEDIDAVTKDAQRLKMRPLEAELYVVGFGPGVSAVQLRALASKDVTSHVFIVQDSSGLDQIQNKLLSALCRDL